MYCRAKCPPTTNAAPNIIPPKKVHPWKLHGSTGVGTGVVGAGSSVVAGVVGGVDASVVLAVGSPSAFSVVEAVVLSVLEPTS